MPCLVEPRQVQRVVVLGLLDLLSVVPYGPGVLVAVLAPPLLGHTDVVQEAARQSLVTAWYLARSHADWLAKKTAFKVQE